MAQGSFFEELLVATWLSWKPRAVAIKSDYFHENGVVKGR